MSPTSKLILSVAILLCAVLQNENVQAAVPEVDNQIDSEESASDLASWNQAGNDTTFDNNKSFGNETDASDEFEDSINDTAIEALATTKVLSLPIAKPIINHSLSPPKHVGILPTVNHPLVPSKPVIQLPAIKIHSATLKPQLPHKPVTSAPNAKSKPKSHVSLRRLFNGRHHFYTTSKSEYQKVLKNLKNYKDEGRSARFAAKADVNATVPIYRVYLKKWDDHMYVPVGDKNWLIKHGWMDEGLIGYCSPKPQPGMSAWHRFFNRKERDHIYTAAKGEVQRLKTDGKMNGWKYEGIKCYVFDK